MVERSVMVAADFILTGGMDRANYALADYLARQGGEVHLVAHEVADGLLGYANVHWQRVARPLGHDALGWGALRRAGMRAAKAAGAGARVFVNGGNCPWPDVNWVHYLHAAYFAPVEGSPPRRVWQRLKHRRALADEQKALRRARVVIANSEATRGEIISRLGVAPERVHTVYYGTDTQVLTPITAGDRAAARAALGWEAERRVVLFVGALGDRRKGFDTVWAAWQQVCADPRWEADLVVVGRGSELEAWQTRTASDAALAARVRFLGLRDDVPRLLAA
ncbi:MAG TPA: glycosyltransferase family 4 protein, partial [Terriglobales bacterium]